VLIHIGCNRQIHLSFLVSVKLNLKKYVLFIALIAKQVSGVRKWHQTPILVVQQLLNSHYVGGTKPLAETITQ